MLPQSVLRNVEPSIHQADACLFADTVVGFEESTSSASSHVTKSFTLALNASARSAQWLLAAASLGLPALALALLTRGTALELGLHLLPAGVEHGHPHLREVLGHCHLPRPPIEPLAPRACGKGRRIPQETSSSMDNDDLRFDNATL